MRVQLQSTTSAPRGALDDLVVVAGDALVHAHVAERFETGQVLGAEVEVVEDDDAHVPLRMTVGARRPQPGRAVYRPS